MGPPSGARFAGVYVATSTSFGSSGALDLSACEAHFDRLVQQGVAGLVPCGSLGEYEALRDDERASVVKAALGAAASRVPVVPGVSGKSASEARRWAEHAGEAGCPAVMCLPPTSHAPTPEEVVAHFAEVARAGLPIIAYNNPYSTRVDLTPALLGRLADEVEAVVAVKEFSQDVRRVAAIRQAAPRLEVICGCDDTVAEAVLMGATGWIAGFANAFPRQSAKLFELCAAGRWPEALPLYMSFLPVLRWDADPRFVQAVKLVQEEVGWYGGPVRLPRLPLPPEQANEVRSVVRSFIEAGLGTASTP
jgi:dihydrodipicolinate synthase/N-acetylneuraminate lyase